MQSYVPLLDPGVLGELDLAIRAMLKLEIKTTGKIYRAAMAHGVKARQAGGYKFKQLKKLLKISVLLHFGKRSR